MSSEPGLPADTLRMGRIGYLNVLPIYHPLEAGIIPHDFEIISGPPAVLNNMMARGELHISSNSCFEYAMRPERYHLVEDLSIGSHGNVMSVLLMSRRPVERLDGQTILISGETHTSVALLRLLMKDHYHCDVRYVTGAVTPTLGTERAPEAFLAIGDEALRLRNHPDYPYRLDLADAWVEWTGLPFIFGVWVVSHDAVQKKALPQRSRRAHAPGPGLGPFPHGCHPRPHRPRLPPVARGTDRLLQRRPDLQPGRTRTAGPHPLLPQAGRCPHDPRCAPLRFFHM